MNELKYQITQIVFLVLLGLGTYWAFTHLDTGVRYQRDEVVTIAQNQESTPDETITIIDNETVLSVDNELPNEPLVSPDEVTTETPTDTNSNSELISELQTIADTGAIMQSGSSGTRVGTVQKFLAVYFEDRDISVDNDYGPGTARLVKEFQTSELNGGDGRVGPNTLGAMVDWLENN